MKLIAITGTPGTGKSTIAKKLSLLLGYEYLDGNLLVKTAGLAEKYDKKRDTAVVDPSLFTRAVLKVGEKAAKKGSKGLVVDSHLSHFLPCRSVNACIVLTCSLEVLEKRMAKKGFKRAKIRENLDAEIFDTILVEASENGHKVVKFDTTRCTEASLLDLAVRMRKLVV